MTKQKQKTASWTHATKGENPSMAYLTSISRVLILLLWIISIKRLSSHLYSTGVEQFNTRGSKAFKHFSTWGLQGCPKFVQAHSIWHVWTTYGYTPHPCRNWHQKTVVFRKAMQHEHSVPLKTNLHLKTFLLPDTAGCRSKGLYSRYHRYS